MIPAAVKAFLDEGESLSDAFWNPANGAAFARSLASDAEDLYAGRITVLLLGKPEELESFLPIEGPAAIASTVSGISPAILFDSERTDVSREFRRLPNRPATSWGGHSGSEELRHLRVIEDVPPLMDGVRLLVIPGARFKATAPEWVAMLRHYVDVVVVSRHADAAGALADVAASLGDAPALVLALAGGEAADGPHTLGCARRCIRLATGADEGGAPLLQRVLPAVLSLVVRHRCMRWLEEWRLELLIEAERLSDVAKVREYVLLLRSSSAPQSGRAPEELWRSAEGVAGSILAGLKSELESDTIEVSSELIVGALGENDLKWEESTLNGDRQVGPTERQGRLSRREFSVRVSSACLDRVESKVSRAVLRQFEEDHKRILSALERIETEVEDRLVQIFGRDSLPAPLRLTPFASTRNSVVDGISVSAGSDEKLVRPGLLDIVKHAHSGVNGIVGIVMGLIVLGGGAFALQQARQLRQIPAILAIVLVAVIANIILQWRRAPRLEARELDAKRQAMAARLVTSTANAIRVCVTRRGKLNDQYLKTVSDELSRFFRDVESSCKERVALASSDQEEGARAVVGNVARRLALVQGAALRAERCIGSLANSADTAYRQLSGDRTTLPPAAPAQRLIPAWEGKPVPFNVSRTPARLVDPPREASRLAFPGREALAKLLRLGGEN